MCEGQPGHNTVIVLPVNAHNPHPAGRPDRRPATDELTRRLIDTAGQLLLEHGVGGLSLRKLATAADTSTMSVYTRFGGKVQLLTAMYREGLARLGSALEEAAEEEGDSLQVLAETGRAYRRSALASPTLYGLMFGPPAAGFEPTQEDAAAAEATYRPLVDAVRRCVDDGQLVGDSESIALHLWAVAHGMVSLELAGRLPAGAEPPEIVYERSLALAAQPFLA